MKSKPHDIRTKNQIKRRKNLYYQERLSRLDRPCMYTTETDIPCPLCGNTIIHWRWAPEDFRSYSTIKAIQIACYGVDGTGCERKSPWIYVNIHQDFKDHIRKAWADGIGLTMHGENSNEN